MGRSRTGSGPAGERRGRTARRRWRAMPFLVLLCAGCRPVRPPPPTLFFHGLPVSGRLADAKRADFVDCFNLDAVHLRCRRHRIMFGAVGPFEGAVDLEGGHGEGGFDQVVFWHERDNDEVYRIADLFGRAGWQVCYTGEGARGDQAIYQRPRAPFRVSMDISFYAKRRLRLVPWWNRRERRCDPKSDLTPRIDPSDHGSTAPPA